MRPTKVLMSLKKSQLESISKSCLARSVSGVSAVFSIANFFRSKLISFNPSLSFDFELNSEAWLLKLKLGFGFQMELEFNDSSEASFRRSFLLFLSSS